MSAVADASGGAASVSTAGDYYKQWFPDAGGYNTGTTNLHGGQPGQSSGLEVVASDALASTGGLGTLVVGLLGGFGGGVSDEVEKAMKSSDPDQLAKFAKTWLAAAGQLEEWSQQLSTGLSQLQSAWSGKDADAAVTVIANTQASTSQQANNSYSMGYALKDMGTDLASCKSSYGHDQSTGGSILNAVTHSHDDDAANAYKNLMTNFGTYLQRMPQQVTTNTHPGSNATDQTYSPTTNSSGVGGTPGLSSGVGAAHGANPSMTTIPKSPGTEANRAPEPVGTSPVTPIGNPVGNPNPISSPVQGPDPITGVGGSNPIGGTGLGSGTSLAGLGGSGGGLDAGGLSGAGLGAGGGLSGAGLGSTGLGSAGLGAGASGLSSGASLSGTAGTAGTGTAGAGGAGAGGAGAAEAGAAGRGGLVGGAPMRGAGGQGAGGDERERTTWLAEDDDVWGGSDAAPGVIS